MVKQLIESLEKETGKKVSLEEGTWALPETEDVKLEAKLELEAWLSKYYHIVGDDDVFNGVEEAIARIEQLPIKNGNQPALKENKQIRKKVLKEFSFEQSHALHTKYDKNYDGRFGKTSLEEDQSAGQVVDSELKVYEVELSSSGYVMRCKFLSKEENVDMTSKIIVDWLKINGFKNVAGRKFETKITWICSPKIIK